MRFVSKLLTADVDRHRMGDADASAELDGAGHPDDGIEHHGLEGAVLRFTERDRTAA